MPIVVLYAHCVLFVLYQKFHRYSGEQLTNLYFDWIADCGDWSGQILFV